MDANEEYVRARWEHVEHKDSAFGVLAGPHYVVVLPLPNMRGGYRAMYGHTEAEAWTAAATFTRQREEEVRQLEKEIETVGRFRKAEEVKARDGMKYGAQWASMYVPDLCVWSRILSRLETALADLKRGWKEQG